MKAITSHVSNCLTCLDPISRQRSFGGSSVCVPYKDDNPAELHIGVDYPRAFLHLLECEYPRDLALISQLLCTNFLEAPFQKIFLPWSITFLVSFYMLGNRALSSVMYRNCMKFFRGNNAISSLRGTYPVMPIQETRA